MDDHVITVQPSWVRNVSPSTSVSSPPRRRSTRSFPNPAVFSLSETTDSRLMSEESATSRSSSSDELLDTSRFATASRKRPIDLSVTAEDGRVIEDVDLGSVAKRQCTSTIVPANLRHPKSIYSGWTPPLPASKERFAIYDLLDEIARLDLQAETRDEYKMVCLTDFTIYRPSTSGNHPLTLAALNDLKTRAGNNSLLFDGILHIGNVRRYVQEVPFEILAIDGYGGDEPSVAHKICIQSLQGTTLNTWFLLEKPSETYQRFYDPFVWLVDFSKHFVGYLLEEEDVRLMDFEDDFCTSLLEKYGENECFQFWHKQFGRTDFRQVIAANFEFLWKESTDIADSNSKHFLWKEVDHKDLRAIEQQKIVETKTIVTPFVYECFKTLYFASHLEKRNSSLPITNVRRRRALAMDLATENDLGKTPATASKVIKAVADVRVGDFVGIPRDSESKWKDAHGTWYGYVQGIQHAGKRKYLHLIWLYRPSDTSCGRMHYPFANELFFSDHCNCEDDPGTSARVYLEDVTEKIDVKFCKTPFEAQGGWFIRQTFSTQDTSFRTFTRRDVVCECQSFNSEFNEFKKIYPIGSTVLAKLHGNTWLEVAEVDRIEDAKHIYVKRLLRRKQAYGDNQARPNELVHTNRTYVVSMEQIVRKCHVRRFPLQQARLCKIPAPYSYNGAGNCWIMTGREKQQTDKLQSLPSCIDGFDPAAVGTGDPPLNGLGLFSGGGSFERGLEEGGGVHFKWAADWDTNALHTYRANLKDKDTKLFLGSVNDYHARALAGDSSPLVATVGAVQFIAAGSPCQGFSKVQPNKLSPESLRNASMVASVATAVDIYHPERGLLENVHGMVMGFGAEQQNVFQQLLCCLVAMGYQVQQFNVDAWSSGSPQSRTRVFVSFTAPGLTPLPPPVESHSHPIKSNKRKLGIGANGAGFGVRELGQATPLRFTTVEDATGDLPSIGDGAVGTCIKFPDHRLGAQQKEWGKLVMRHVPLFPKCMSWRRTINMKHSPMPKQLIKECRRGSNLWNADSNKSFMRTDPDGVFSTIVTRPTVQCTKNGKFMHWQEHRPLTIMEARRAQSYPDHEVLVGLPASQWKIVGNSVARTVAVAFGMSLREAWLADQNRDLPRLPPVDALTSMDGLNAGYEEQASADTDELGFWPAEDDLDELPVKSVASSLVATRHAEDNKDNITGRAGHDDNVPKIAAFTIRVNNPSVASSINAPQGNGVWNYDDNNDNVDMIMVDSPPPVAFRASTVSNFKARNSRKETDERTKAGPRVSSSVQTPVTSIDRAPPWSRDSARRSNAGLSSCNTKESEDSFGTKKEVKAAKTTPGVHAKKTLKIENDDDERTTAGFAFRQESKTPGVLSALPLNAKQSDIASTPRSEVVKAVTRLPLDLFTPSPPPTDSAAPKCEGSHMISTQSAVTSHRASDGAGQCIENVSHMVITMESRIRVVIPTSAGRTAEERQRQQQQVADTLGTLWTGK